MMRKISSPFAYTRPLHSVVASRELERQAAALLAPHTLMQRAGLSIARLALAVAPNARCIWIACGPGNNGGDGFEAAVHLHQWGKKVALSWTGLGSTQTCLPPDAHAAREKALAAGVPMVDAPPAEFDLCIDALLGLGSKLDASRADNARMVDWLAKMQSSGAPRLSVDLPTGLDADTGFAPDLIAAYASSTRAAARFTLSLLTLKPGLFTAQGRDQAGEVWFDDLGVGDALGCAVAKSATAYLLGADRVAPLTKLARGHSSHKGSFGDVAVLGGESTATSHMAGAAILAARAALHGGAGRVYVALLGSPAVAVDLVQPELMFRAVDALDLAQQVVVCGCGGGEWVASLLPKVLQQAPRLVLDADALNAIATDPELQSQLSARDSRAWQTVLTPHPLEAARLLGCSTAAVQAQRLQSAQQLAERFACVVVLKGSGTVIAAPGQPTCINPTGNALLATAGTGDVLAGMLGAAMAQGQSAYNAACCAVYQHGRVADGWAVQHSCKLLTASAMWE
jgi:hydroxyethylthiazole kinase-like uncharacterized protein yjeF